MRLAPAAEAETKALVFTKSRRDSSFLMRFMIWFSNYLVARLRR